MGKVILRIKNDAILYRMIAFFFIASTVIILFLTTVIFSLFSSRLKDEIYRAQVQNLQQISNTVSFRAEYVNSLMLQAKEDEMISRLFYTTDISDAANIRKRLDSLRSSVKHLNSIYVYNEYSDIVFYSGENMLPFLNPTMGFSDKGFLDILENIDQYPKYTPILRKLSVNLPVGREYEIYVYTYLIYDSYASGSVKNIMAFNFQLGWMSDALNFIATDYGVAEENWIIDNKRQIVYTNSGKLIGSICEQEDVPDEIFTNKSGYLFTGSDNNRKMIVYANPSQMGYDNWTFISWNDYASLMQPIEQVRRMIYILGATVIFVSLCAIFGLSHLLYQPVRTTIDRNKVLEKENADKREMERVLFLRKLFLGDVTDDLYAIRSQFGKYHIEGTWDGNVQVFMISIDDRNAFVNKFLHDMDTANITIEETFNHVLQQLFETYFSVRMHTGIWAICVLAEDDNKKDFLYEQMNQVMNEQLGLSVSVAASQIGHSVRDIPYLYSETVNIHSYAFLWGKNCLITHNDIQKQEQSKYEYPHDIEKKLLNHLFSGKYNEAMADYEAFDAALRLFSVEEIRLSSMLLAYAIRTASRKAMAEASGTLMEFDRFYKKLQAAEDISEVNEMFSNLIKEITDKLKRNSKERHESLISQTEAYVEKNYSDINLSMNQIADHVNISAAYLGRLFKQVTGNTFNDYLTRFRLQKACALLRGTDLTVNDISDQVGFTNSSYFYIVFKKNLECTPNQYRKQFSDTEAAGE